MRSGVQCADLAERPRRQHSQLHLRRHLQFRQPQCQRRGLHPVRRHRRRVRDQPVRRYFRRDRHRSLLPVHGAARTQSRFRQHPDRLHDRHRLLRRHQDHVLFGKISGGAEHDAGQGTDRQRRRRRFGYGDSGRCVDLHDHLDQHQQRAAEQCHDQRPADHAEQHRLPDRAGQRDLCADRHLHGDCGRPAEGLHQQHRAVDFERTVRRFLQDVPGFAAHPRVSDAGDDGVQGIDAQHRWRSFGQCHGRRRTAVHRHRRQHRQGRADQCGGQRSAALAEYDHLPERPGRRTLLVDGQLHRDRDRSCQRHDRQHRQCDGHSDTRRAVEQHRYHARVRQSENDGRQGVVQQRRWRWLAHGHPGRRADLHGHRDQHWQCAVDECPGQRSIDNTERELLRERGAWRNLRIERHLHGYCDRCH